MANNVLKNAERLKENENSQRDYAREEETQIFLGNSKCFSILPCRMHPISLFLKVSWSPFPNRPSTLPC